MHEKAVAAIATQVAEFYRAKQPFRIFHGSTNSTRVQTFSSNATLDISHLNHVLDVDKDKRTVVCEPNVSMRALVSATLKYGLIPKVVMELPSITVGGGIQGVGEESSSFKYGCFSESCNWYELVTGDGRIIKVSPREHSDLFYGLPGSYGSLGVLTAADIQLIPAKQYVRLAYQPVSSFMSAIEKMDEACVSGQYDFVEGILFSKSSGVVITGNLSDEIVKPLTQFSRARDEWFYLHAGKMTGNAGSTETVPLVDYLFRYDRGAFWTGQYTFERAGYPFNRLTRWLLNPVLHAHRLYEALQQTNAAQEYFVQDLVVPREQSIKFLKFLDKTFGQYPLWLCPLKPGTGSPFLVNNISTDLAINIGAWLGKRYSDLDEFISLNRKVEIAVQKHSGKKWLYAHSYYTPEEFWNIYGKDWYYELRKIYGVEYLPDAYEKTKSVIGPVKSIKKAAFKTLFGLTRLRVR